MGVVIEDRANRTMSVIRDGKISRVIWSIGMLGFTVASVLFVFGMPLVVIGALPLAAMGLEYPLYEKIYFNFMLWWAVSTVVALSVGTFGVVLTEEGD